MSVSILYETYLEVPAQGWNHSPSPLEPPRASAVTDLGKLKGLMQVHTQRLHMPYAHASPQNRMAGSGQHAHSLSPSHSQRTRFQPKADLPEIWMPDGPCGLWLVAEPAATIAIREIRGLDLGLGLAIIRKSGNLKSLSPQ